MQNWFEINNIETIDTPALIFYKERIEENIRQAKKLVSNLSRPRPHVKTNKCEEVCELMMREGITKFKCATIAEAEMLGNIGAPDVLLAYQPTGPKITRLLKLVERFPITKFSCLVDNFQSAQELSRKFSSSMFTIDVFIDVNVGMNRTGIPAEKVMELFEKIFPLHSTIIAGLHAYDGHITEQNFSERKNECAAAFGKVFAVKNEIEKRYEKKLSLIAGGSPTFSVHVENEEAECSPGTFVLWDWSYKTTYPEEPFKLAALVASRVVSIVNETMMTIDLGHKSVAAENPLPRVHFLNALNAIPAGHSEEHMKLVVPNTEKFKIGDVLYGVPVHICPTVALYERAFVAENQSVVDEWKITARDKRITV